jgi:hypothetical protein
MQFSGRDGVAVVAEHPHCRKPLIQPESGVFHDRAYLDGELATFVLKAALPNAARCQEANPEFYNMGSATVKRFWSAPGRRRRFLVAYRTVQQ